MRDEYDFSDAVKHPLAGKFKGKYTVTIHYDFNGCDGDIETNDTNTKKPIPDAKADQQTAAQGF